MKGIILAGGTGSRLSPVTKAISKQLLPIYDKPMIYYPLSVLMLANIREILIITTDNQLENFKKLLGDGRWLGITIEYKIQENPNGIAEAFIIGEDFIKDDSVCLILGDNIFYGQNFTQILNKASKLENGAIIFAYHVDDPKQYGVITFDQFNNIISIHEKPDNPKSNYAVTGIYFYDNRVIEFAKSLKPSKRGELEISDINQKYLDQSNLEAEILGRGFAWLDTGNHRSLLEAGIFVQTVEERQGLKIACIEEIAFTKKWITENHLKKIINSLGDTKYREYLEQIN
jgi:glucose-1-phosphate thymidylyltransferase